MTTFTSDDREEEYKKILAAAPNQPGYEDAVPIPFAGWVNMSPPHIVDSGASVMLKKLTDEEIYEFTHRMIICSGQNPNAADINIFGLTRIVEDILKKAQEK